MDRLDLVVTDVRAETAGIRAVTLARLDGDALPTWNAGSHIDLCLPSGDTRSYSLITTSAGEGSEKPRTYRIGVRLESASTGGSVFVHGLKVGDRVTASPPKNNFPFDAGDGAVVLLAGGIGITPIISMAAELSARARPFRLIYAGRTQSELAFLPELRASFGSQLELHEDDRAGVLDIAALMRAIEDGSPLYVCGPLSMIDAAIANARMLGWPDGHLRFEIFTRPVVDPGDAGFEVVLAKSGKRFRVPADKTILESLIAQGEDHPHDCKLGDCGVCQVGVIDGIPDHRDYYLSDKERASNKLMQVCVSRSKTPTLVLDL